MQAYLPFYFPPHQCVQGGTCLRVTLLFFPSKFSLFRQSQTFLDLMIGELNAWIAFRLFEIMAMFCLLHPLLIKTKSYYVLRGNE